MTNKKSIDFKKLKGIYGSEENTAASDSALNDLLCAVIILEIIMECNTGIDCDECPGCETHLGDENRKTFDFIFDYADKDLTCSDCGTHRSVKYKIGDKPFCNLCVLINT